MRIRRAVVDAVVEHARRDEPLECCGLLIGTDEEVIESHPARNLRQSAVAYLVAPEDHFAAIRSARAHGREVLGAYHSHPHSAAVPSATDIREAADPGFLYLIVSLMRDEAEVAGFRVRDGAAFQVVLEHI